MDREPKGGKIVYAGCLVVVFGVLLLVGFIQWGAYLVILYELAAAVLCNSSPASSSVLLRPALAAQRSEHLAPFRRGQIVGFPGKGQKQRRSPQLLR